MTQTGRPPSQTGNESTPTGESIRDHFENAVEIAEGELESVGLFGHFDFVLGPPVAI